MIIVPIIMHRCGEDRSAAFEFVAGCADGRRDKNEEILRLYVPCFCKESDMLCDGV